MLFHLSGCDVGMGRLSASAILLYGVPGLFPWVSGVKETWEWRVVSIHAPWVWLTISFRYCHPWLPRSHIYVWRRACAVAADVAALGTGRSRRKLLYIRRGGTCRGRTCYVGSLQHATVPQKLRSLSICAKYDLFSTKLLICLFYVSLLP